MRSKLPFIVRIGETVDLHPDYAGVRFRETFGMTLGEYVLQHRVAHAHRILATTREKVTPIAYASGFGSISRVNAAFKAPTGCKPTEYRRRHLLHEGDLRGAAAPPRSTTSSLS